MFSYTKAFSRNLGWVSIEEQCLLSTKKVAIAGMGGVGALHAITLARLGIQHFKIADMDTFDIENFNRQAGAFMSTIGQEKTKTMSEIIKDINPNASIEEYSEITAENVTDFLSTSDIYIDGMDVLAPEARKILFAESYKQKIPFITAGPIGCGTAYMIFTEKSPNPIHFFDFKDGLSKEELIVRFLCGLAPQALQRSYMHSTEFINLKAGKLPSLSIGPSFASGVVATNVFKILLKRGQIHPAPTYHQFDGYKNKYVRGKLWLGNKCPLQRLKIALMLKMVDKLEKNYTPLPEKHWIKK